MPAELLVIVSKLFQMVGPQTEKARWPNCFRVRWTMAARDDVYEQL